MNKTQSGFTLIELVMVIVILGILAAVAVPRFVDLGGTALTAAKSAASGGIKSGHAVAVGELRRLPTVGEIVARMDGVTAKANDAGILATIDGLTYTAATFQDTCGGTPTVDTTPGTTDVVSCISNIP